MGRRIEEVYDYKCCLRLNLKQYPTKTGRVGAKGVLKALSIASPLHVRLRDRTIMMY